VVKILGGALWSGLVELERGVVASWLPGAGPDKLLVQLLLLLVLLMESVMLPDVF